MTRPSPTELAVDVLTTADGFEKTAKSRAAAALWLSSVAAGNPLDIGTAAPPDRPARPVRPELLPPDKMPRRKTGSVRGRIALLHAIPHERRRPALGHHPALCPCADAQGLIR